MTLRTCLKSLTALAFVGALNVASAGPLSATERWESIKAEAYAGRAIHDGRGIIDLKAPYRPDDVRSVPLTADVRFKNGRTIKSVSFVVDQNPAPVAAVFRLGGERKHAAITTNIRLDQQSDVHIVVEASDGELFAIGQLVKFAGGQASCSAPPVGDPDEILANMGKMEFAAIGEAATGSRQKQRANVDLNHPNHTGMVLDPITLFYIPLLMVSKVEARQGDELVFEMTGSISLAQNPRVEFDYVTNGAPEMSVTATDTSGASWEQRFPIGPAS
jgi:sulfur-oxidizing protein SoxY